MKKKKKRKKEKKDNLSSSKLFDLLLVVFRENPSKKLNYKQLSKILNIKSLGAKMQVVSVLEKMMSSGVVFEEQRGLYRLAQKTTIVTTVVKKTERTGVYVTVDKDKQVFIPKNRSLFALTGDEVEIQIFQKRRKKYEGEVIRVLKRKKDNFVGVIDNSSGNNFLLPDDRRVFFDIFLPPKKTNPSFLNKKVLVQVIGWGDEYKNPVGRVVKTIGPINDSASEICSILYDYGLSDVFPEKVSLSAEKIKDIIPQAEINRRLDLRKTTTFTIDPEDAKDFDDALSVKKLSKNLWEVGVHIADVSYYVKKDDIIDVEAKDRATSVYLVDRVVPMLPENLSNNICSLKPLVDRLAYSVLFEMDQKANIVNYKIKKTVIHSDVRFTYKSAQKIITSKSGVLSEELLLLSQLSKILRNNRQKKGSINFESSEVKFVLDENNLPVDVFLKETLQTNFLIEEFMLLANKTIAKHIGFPKKTAKPFIYRVHDLPDEEKINSLEKVVKKLGYSINKKSPKTLSKSLNVLLENSKGTQEQKMIETITVRSMAKAVYSSNNIGHYGLGFNYYSHFTSPIRRYPDLIVHRLLEYYISSGKNVSQTDLELLSRHCSDKEKIASTAERDSIKFMQALFLKSKISHCFEGVISGVTEWGLYVELTENRCEGLVKISSLKGDHYVFDEKKYALTGYQTRICYQLGQNVKIKIRKVNVEKKQMDFIIV